MKKLLFLFFIVFLSLVIFARSCNVSVDASNFLDFWRDTIGDVINALRRITDTVGGILNGIFGGD